MTTKCKIYPTFSQKPAKIFTNRHQQSVENSVFTADTNIIITRRAPSHGIVFIHLYAYNIKEIELEHNTILVMQEKNGKLEQKKCY